MEPEHSRIHRVHNWYAQYVCEERHLSCNIPKLKPFPSAVQNVIERMQPGRPPMTKPMSLYLPDLLNSSVPFRRVGTVLLVSLALIAVCPEVAKATDSEIAPGLQQS